MASSIGIRVYQITINRKGNRARLAFDATGLSETPPIFISKFISVHPTPTQDSDRERSWYFEPKEKAADGSERGYVHYGTFGFESNLKDSKTKTINYRRKATDVEEVPLFFEFWCPEESDFALVAFQSFQGRSCINLVMQAMQQAFEATNDGAYLRFQKLIPSDEAASLFHNLPVKRLRLIRRNVNSELADRYASRRTAREVNIELTMSAKRMGILGYFGEMASSIRKEGSGVVLHDGIAFNEAVADIKIGGRTRPVGIFGDNSEAGIIDLTDSIVRGEDGHPTFSSTSEQTSEILTEFYSAVRAIKS